jgi:hypothetical protein
MVAAESNRGQYVFFVARNYDADRDLPIIGPVGGIESTTAGIEANLSPKMAAERSFKRDGIELHGMDRRRGHILLYKILRLTVQNIFEDAGARRKAESDLPVERRGPSPGPYDAIITINVVAPMSMIR